MRFKDEKVLVSIYAIPKMQIRENSLPKRVVLGRKPEEGCPDNREYWTAYFQGEALTKIKKCQSSQGMCFGFISDLDIKPSVWNKETGKVSNGYIIVKDFVPYNN